MNYKKIYRSRNDSVIAGVCGGLGQFFGIDPSVLRVIFVISTFFFGVSIWPYLIAWVLIPLRPRTLREEDLRYKDVYDDFDESDW